MDHYAIDLHPDRVEGLTLDERKNLVKLMEVYHSHISKNAEKNKYYEGHVTLGEVNLGIALPKGMRGLEVFDHAVDPFQVLIVAHPHAQGDAFSAGEGRHRQHHDQNKEH